MKSRIVPIFEQESNSKIYKNDEEYDKYLCCLYEENYFLADMLEKHKENLLNGENFNCFNKEKISILKFQLSHDFSKLNIERDVFFLYQILKKTINYKNIEITQIKYACEGIHDDFLGKENISSEANRILAVFL